VLGALPGLLFGVLRYERLDDVENLFLLAAWQSANGFKKLAGAANRGSGRAFSRTFVQQLVNGNTKCVSQLAEGVAAHSGASALPMRDGLLGNAELLGKLGLRKSGLFAQARESVAEA
jgi:hypothetical protein